MPETDWKQVCATRAEGTPPERCAYYGDPNGCNAPTLGKHPEGDLAERLQEALEKAERRIAELERAPGNAAAMRDLLEKIRHEYGWGRIGCRTCVSSEADVERVSDLFEKQIDAALAAQPRNCDRFKTLDEAREAFQDLRGHKILADVELWDSMDEAGALVRWLFATADGGAKCVNGLRGEPDCRGCNEHCEDVRKRNCFYWNPDIEGGLCALTGKKSCPISCDNFHIPEKVSPPPAEGGAE